MPEARRGPLPELLSAFAASRDGQMALAQRIEALAEGVAAGLAGVVVRLGTLPGAARFEPFAQVPAVPAAAADETVDDTQAPARAARRATPRAGARSARPAPGLPPSAPLLAAGVAGLGAAARLAAATLQPAVSALPGAATVQAAFSSGAAGTAQTSAAPLTAPEAAQATRLLTGLMQAVSAQLAASGSPQALADLTARGALAEVGAMATAAVTAGVGALTGSGTRPASRPASASPHTITPWIAHALQAMDALRQQVPQPESAAAAPAGTSKLPALIQRATSRLLAPSPSTGEAPRDERPAAPECTPDEDEFTAALQRALLDQAWLRGVDLR